MAPKKPTLPVLDQQAEAARALELIQNARPAERTLPLCMRGDLQAEWEELHRQLEELGKTAGRDSLNPPPAAVELRERILAVQEEMAAGTVVFRVRAMGKKAYNEAVTNNPPRPGNAFDNEPHVGYNIEAVEREQVRQGIVFPELDDATFAHLEDTLTQWQWGQLVRTANEVNLGPVTVPFSLAVSPPPRN